MSSAEVAMTGERIGNLGGFGLHGFDIPINIDSICDKELKGNVESFCFI